VSATYDRPQTPGEEIANSVSHGFGLCAAIGALPVLVGTTARSAATPNVVAASVFSATMVLLYGASTLYHALPLGRAKRLLARVDHAAIFVFIAGSYTPFTLGVLHGAWGFTLFGLVWALAITGVLLKAFGRLRHPWLSIGIYIGMGWLALAAAVPLVERMRSPGLALLVAGGVAYTAGVPFYANDARWRYGHFVWHLFVVAGSACHFLAVLWYAC
jgi:hemolysin III